MKKHKLNEVEKSKEILNFCNKAWYERSCVFLYITWSQISNNFFINTNHKERLNNNTRSYMYVYAKYVGMK